MKKQPILPLALDQPDNVAVRRQTVNQQEAGNVHARDSKSPDAPLPTFAKHGTFWNTPHPISSAWE